VSAFKLEARHRKSDVAESAPAHKSVHEKCTLRDVLMVHDP
jgi:hypothetical protein